MERRDPGVQSAIPALHPGAPSIPLYPALSCAGMSSKQAGSAAHLPRHPGKKAVAVHLFREPSTEACCRVRLRGTAALYQSKALPVLVLALPRTMASCHHEFYARTRGNFVGVCTCGGGSSIEPLSALLSPGPILVAAAR